MPYCLVENCKNRGQKISGVRFYRFPGESDPERRNEWISACGRETAGPSSSICELHFDQSAFNPFSVFCGVRKTLKPDAVPTLCLPGVSSLPEVKEDAFQNKAHRSTIRKAFRDYAILSKPSTEDVGVQADDFFVRIRNAENKRLRKQVEELTGVLNKYKKLFSATQQKVIEADKAVRRWADKDISEAQALYRQGPRAYRFLRNQKFPLPGPSTLRRYKRINKLSNMENNDEMTEYSVIAFDEIKVDESEMDYDIDANEVDIPPSASDDGSGPNGEQVIYCDPSMTISISSSMAEQTICKKEREDLL